MIYAFIILVGLTAIFLPWYVSLILFVLACFSWNELRVARERREWREDWEQREIWHRMGQRR